MSSFDVVIIGAGLAGLRCARLLAASNAKVLLVDRKADLTKGVHTTGIFVRKTFEDFDFPVGTLGRPIRDVILYSPGLKTLRLHSPIDEFRVGNMRELYSRLVAECVNSGVEFRPATRFAGVEKLAASSVVTLESGGRREAVEAKVLVGADGANSAVAKALNLEQNREWIVGYEEVFKSRSTDRDPVLHCFLDADLAPGYLAWVADDGEGMHVGVGGYPSAFDPQDALKMFKAKVASILPDHLNVPCETRGGRIPVGGILRKISNHHGLLIGDAAGAVSPLTAGGLDPCIRLSTYAAQIIARRLVEDDPQIMNGYSGEPFRARFVSRLWMRRAIAKFQNQLLLEAACGLMRTPIGKRFAEHVFFGRGSFPDVPLHNSSEIGVLQP